MRVFFITNTVGDSGGSEIITKTLLKELVAQGHELFIFTPCPYKLQGAQTYVVPHAGHHAFHKFEAPFFTYKAIALAREFRPDIVHSHSNSMMGLVGHFISRAMRVPHIFSIEVVSPHTRSMHGKVIYFFEKLLIPRLNYDLITTWAENTASYLRKMRPGARVEIIPAAVDLGKFNLQASGSEIKKKFGGNLITSLKTLAGLNTAALKEIIDAMPYVSEKHPEYKYVIFGDGPGRKGLEEYVKEKNLREFVLLPGSIAPEKCNEVWAATSIAPHAFAFEITIAISLLEYMAFGVACVATDVGNIPQLLKNAGIVVKRNSPKEMAGAINTLIENPSLRKKLGENARRKVLEEFDVEKVAAKMSKLYKEVAAK